MQSARRRGTARQRDINAFHGVGILGCLQSELLLLDALSQRGAHFIQLCADSGLLIRWHVAHAPGDGGEAAFLAKTGYTKGLKGGFVMDARQGGETFGLDLVELGKHGNERMEVETRKPGLCSPGSPVDGLQAWRASESRALHYAAAFLARAALACWTRAVKAAASLIAMSERTLRSSSMEAAFRPSIKRL